MIVLSLVTVANHFLCLIYRLNIVIATHVWEENSTYRVWDALWFQVSTGVWGVSWNLCPAVKGGGYSISILYSCRLVFLSEDQGW